MIKVRGITLKQFNDTIEVMRSVYPFKNETTRLADIEDHRTLEPRHIEIHTVDERTGVDIILMKRVEGEIE